MSASRRLYNSVILDVCASFLVPVTTMFAFYVFFRGHNQAGGGFIAGLIAVTGIIIHALTFGVESARRSLAVPLRAVFGMGWFVAVLAGLIPMLFGHEFLSSGHTHLELGILGEWHLVGSTFFDLGVFLIVIGVSAELVFRLGEQASADPPAPETLT